MVSGPQLIVPLGREAEVERIERFLDGLVGGSRTLLLEGEVGIGKTTVMRYAATRGVARGFIMLAAHPVEAEVPLEFAALADLIDGVPSDLLEALPDPQRRAIDVAVRREKPAEVPVDARTVATAALTVVRALAQVQPVVLLVDDLPWVDLPSARVVSFLMRRTQTAAVGLLAAARTDWSGDTSATLADDLDEDSVDRVRIGPLSVGAFRLLLSSRAGTARSRLLRLHEVSRGNPMLALELASEPRSTEQVDGTIPVPASLGRLLLTRINTLSPSARELLLLAALSNDPAVSPLRSAAAGGARTDDDLDALVRIGILNRVGDRLAFAHPFMRSVVISDARPAARRAAHRRLATVVDTPEAVSRHLALASAGPSDEAAAAAEDAARIAASRGACDTAADLGELAVTLTPEGSPAERYRRIALEAEYRFEASDPERAATLLEPIIDAVERGPRRAELLRRLARYRGYRGGKLADWAVSLEEALADSGDDLALRAAILRDLGVAASNASDQAAAVEYGTAALKLAEQCGDLDLQAQLCAGFAWVGFMGGQGVRHDLIDRALSCTQSSLLSMELRPRVVVGHIMRLSDDLDAARALYEQEYQQAKQDGVETGLPLLLWGYVDAETYAGNWDRARLLADEGVYLAEESRGELAVGLVAASRCLVEVCQGQLDNARRDATRAIEVAHAVGYSFPLLMASHALGLAELSVGDPAAAHRQLGPLAELVRASGVAEPAMVRFLPDEIEALVRLGELADAAELLEPFETRSIELKREWGIAVAGRCRGLLLAASRDIPAAEAALAGALEAHERVPLPFEHARTLLVAGEIHRRARHKSLAAARLQAALAIFERLGAPLWVERTLAELDRIGRPKGAAVPPSALTPAERRVADLVASGLSNPQVAANLFMAQRTVEAHLSRIYRKLGVRSRTELANSIRHSGSALT